MALNQSSYPDLETLPLKTLHDLRFAHDRYGLTFEEPQDLSGGVPALKVPDESLIGKIPWMVEAPLNTIEMMEAILQPAEPYKVYTAHHIPRGCLRESRVPGRVQGARRRYAEYRRYQGCLEKDREISFIIIDQHDIWTIRDKARGFSPVRLHYISLPWFRPSGRIFAHPLALVLHNKPHPGTVHTYENRILGLKKELGILEQIIDQRNYLRPGATPLPECLLDWFAGIPGRSQALPYYQAVVATREVKNENKCEKFCIKREEAKVKVEGAEVD